MFIDLQCIVVTPERTVRDSAAEFVVLPLDDGEIGVAPGHSPMIGRLGCGEMRITGEDRTDRYYVEGGFVEMSGHTISVLTNHAIPAGEVDETTAQEQLQSALKRPAHTPEQMAIRDRIVTQARAQLRVARRAKG